MNLIRFAIERPVAVVAAVFMVVMFGLVALQSIPIQLTPDVRKPINTGFNRYYFRQSLIRPRLDFMKQQFNLD